MVKIFNRTGRAVLAGVVEPIARFLLRVGVTPNVVTIAGTVGVVTASLLLGARGHLVAGALVVTFFALTDLLDGTMARMGHGSTFGALLDSSMDRIADAAVFGAVIYYLYGQDNPYNGLVAGLICLAAGQVVSYVKARAQSLGLNADVGIAERLERLIIVGIGGLISGSGFEWGLPAALWLLAGLSVVTVFQRLIHAARTAKAPAA